MIILNAILALAGVAAIASVVNLFDRKKQSDNTSIPMRVQLPGNLPVIALIANNGQVLNFLLDSGSNISHICSEHFENLGVELLGTYENGEIAGLGANNVGITVCEATLKDVLGHEYNVVLSVSDQFSEVARTIKDNIGIQVHGLLGTDFLKTYNYVIDFKSLEVYPRK